MSQLTTRDYKGAGRSAIPPPGGLKEFLLGALAGALLAGLGTALVMREGRRAAACAAGGAVAQAPGHTRGAGSPAAPSAAPAAAVRGRTPAPGSPAAKTGGAGNDPLRAKASAAAAQGGYDFYKMLPNLKVTVPQPTAPGARGVGPNGRTTFSGYVLQVGAYRDVAQARKVVAYLDSLGILAHIDTVQDGGATLYRVRIGPIIEQSELNRFQGVLKRIGMPGVLIPGATH